MQGWVIYQKDDAVRNRAYIGFLQTAFAARGMDDGIAAACAVCVHGAAADKAAAVTGRDAMTASDVTAHIATVLKEITEQ